MRACQVIAWIAVLGLLAACRREATPRTHSVAIRNLAYEPDSLVVAVGDTVVWTNYDVLPHTVTSVGKEWDSGSIPANGEWQLVVRDSVTQRYLCTFHPTMRGTVVVRP